MHAHIHATLTHIHTQHSHTHIHTTLTHVTHNTQHTYKHNTHTHIHTTLTHLHTTLTHIHRERANTGDLNNLVKDNSFQLVKPYFYKAKLLITYISCNNWPL